MSSSGEAFSDRLDVVEADVQEIREGVTDVMEGLASMGSALQRVEGLVGAGADDSTGEPLAWVDTASAEQWEELIVWVDRLWWTYELPSVLPSCWPAHLGVAEELSALRRAWRLAAKTNSQDEDAMAYWHDRLLEPTLRRLASNSTYPNLQKCAKQGEHRTPDRVRVTDRRVMTLTAAADAKTEPAWRSAGVALTSDRAVAASEQAR